MNGTSQKLIPFPGKEGDCDFMFRKLDRPILEKLLYQWILAAHEKYKEANTDLEKELAIAERDLLANALIRICEDGYAIKI